MELETINIKDIKPAEYNPRYMKDADRQKLRKNIKTFGLVDPLIIDLTDNNTLIGGHQRLEVLKEMDPEQDLKLLRLGDIGLIIKETDLKIKDKNDQKALNLALNKITGDWDKNKLDNIFEELAADNYIIDLTGFDKIDIINNEYETELNDINTDTTEATTTKPQKERREVWQPVDFSKESNTPTFEEGTVEEDVYIERLMFHSNEDKETFKQFLKDNRQGTETEAETINRLINRPVHASQPATMNIIFKNRTEHEKYKLLITRLQSNNILIPYIIIGADKQ